MNPHAVSLAVIAGRGEGDAFELSAGLFHGTAFCLAPHLFLTAAHVYKDAAAAGEVAVARLTPGQHQIQTVSEAEIFDDIDLAILNCRDLAAEILPFVFDPLGFLVDVVSLGFAFGLEMPMYHLRAFKGHVVTRRALPNLTAAPPGYEVSFVPPVGLSGAPLLTHGLEGGAVAGMVLTHHTATYRDRTMDLGLALDIQEILTLESHLVGGSVAERLFRRSRIRRRRT